MKVAFFLGSFDPPHIGHGFVVSKALESMDFVVVVPAMQNPWKERKSTDFELRCQMCEKTFLPLGESVLINDIEKTLEAPYYSYKTLKNLKEIWNSAELYLICGSDVYDEIKNWKNSEWILENFKLLPISRDIVTVSSSQIREMVKNDETQHLSFLVTHNVEKMINENNLYK